MDFFRLGAADTEDETTKDETKEPRIDTTVEKLAVCSTCKRRLQRTYEEWGKGHWKATDIDDPILRGSRYVSQWVKRLHKYTPPDFATEAIERYYGDTDMIIDCMRYVERSKRGAEAVVNVMNLHPSNEEIYRLGVQFLAKCDEHLRRTFKVRERPATSTSTSSSSTSTSLSQTRATSDSGDSDDRRDMVGYFLNDDIPSITDEYWRWAEKDVFYAPSVLDSSSASLIITATSTRPTEKSESKVATEEWYDPYDYDPFYWYPPGYVDRKKQLKHKGKEEKEWDKVGYVDPAMGLKGKKKEEKEWDKAGYVDPTIGLKGKKKEEKEWDKVGYVDPLTGLKGKAKPKEEKGKDYKDGKWKKGKGKDDVASTSTSKETTISSSLFPSSSTSALTRVEGEGGEAGSWEYGSWSDEEEEMEIVEDDVFEWREESIVSDELGELIEEAWDEEEYEFEDGTNEFAYVPIDGQYAEVSRKVKGKRLGI